MTTIDGAHGIQGEPPLRWGSDAHKQAFCRMLLDTHDPYRPAIIDWPTLEPDALARITGLPIWDIAVDTENRAAVFVSSYADLVDDPLLRQAVVMDGAEEARHREVLSHMVRAYGIELGPEKTYARPADPEWAFMRIGYSECLDSFFAFGLFELARRSGYFPPELVETFEPVIREESRHIVFFINWLAWHRRRQPLWRRPWFELKVLRVLAGIAWSRLGTARAVGSAGRVSPAERADNFTMNGASSIAVETSFAALVDLCQAENARRMAELDPRLMRPRLFPTLMRLIRPLLGSPKPAT